MAKATCHELTKRSTRWKSLLRRRAIETPLHSAYGSRRGMVLGSGPVRKFAGSARDLDMKGSAPHARDLTVPVWAGFRCHANTQIPAPRRDQLERARRYMTRGAVALEQLVEDAHGDLVST